MRINAVSSVRLNDETKPQPQQQSFKGIWMRVGQNYLDLDRYCAGAFYKFKDGKALTETFDKLGRRLLAFEDNGMTVKEGKDAWKFLFEHEETAEGYEALKKLRQFIMSKVSNGKHNTMFLEKEDAALVTAERKPITIAQVNQKIREFATNHNLIKPEAKIAGKASEKAMTTEELQKFLNETGVA